MRFRKLVLSACTVSSFLLFTAGLISVISFTTRPVPREISPAVPRAEAKKPVRNYFENISLLEVRPYLPPVNLILFGVDEDGLRSDVMVLVNYDPGSNKVNLFSIPRDTRVNVKGKALKINALIGMGGEKLAMTAIEKLTGIKADYYLTINFKGFRKVVDVLGGIRINVPRAMNYDDTSQNLHIHLKKGLQLLDGNKAEQYIRYRKGNRANEGYVNGDLDRIKVQQSFIKEFIRQKINLRYITKADDIFIIMKKYVKTNIRLSDINKYIYRIKDISENNIDVYMCPGQPRYTDRLWYYICDLKAAKELIRKNFIK